MSDNLITNFLESEGISFNAKKGIYFNQTLKVDSVSEAIELSSSAINQVENIISIFFSSSPQAGHVIDGFNTLSTIKNFMSPPVLMVPFNISKLQEMTEGQNTKKIMLTLVKAMRIRYNISSYTSWRQFLAQLASPMASPLVGYVFGKALSYLTLFIAIGLTLLSVFNLFVKTETGSRFKLSNVVSCWLLAGFFPLYTIILFCVNIMQFSLKAFNTMLKGMNLKEIHFMGQKLVELLDKAFDILVLMVSSDEFHAGLESGKKKLEEAIPKRILSFFNRPPANQKIEHPSERLVMNNP